MGTLDVHRLYQAQHHHQDHNHAHHGLYILELDLHRPVHQPLEHPLLELFRLIKYLWLNLMRHLVYLPSTHRISFPLLGISLIPPFRRLSGRGRIILITSPEIGVISR